MHANLKSNLSVFRIGEFYVNMDDLPLGADELGMNALQTVYNIYNYECYINNIYKITNY